MIRPMRPDEEFAVRELRRRCHSGEVPLGFYFVHPTLVLEQDSEVIGFTSFTLSPMPEGYVAYGVDLCVAPEYRGLGHGRALHAERARLCREHGAVDFVGTAEPGNEPMIRILASAGLSRATSADGRDIYIGAL